MKEEVQLYLDMADESMRHSEQHLEDSLAHIRAGKANPNSGCSSRKLLWKQCSYQ